MDKKGFTLLEIIIVIVVLGILATLGLPAYNNTIENSKSRICQANLDALKVALDIYAMDHDIMPGSLSELPAEYINKAYASIMQRKDAWKIKLAYFIVGLQEKGFAYASPFIKDLAKGNMKMITCPNDTRSVLPAHGSYGLNVALRGMSSQEYQRILSDTPLIGDCNIDTFSSEADLDNRHTHFKLLDIISSPEHYHNVATKALQSRGYYGKRQKNE